MTDTLCDHGSVFSLQQDDQSSLRGSLEIPFVKKKKDKGNPFSPRHFSVCPLTTHLLQRSGKLLFSEPT